MSNAEWLTYCCDYLNPVSQVLIIEAIQRYVNEILENKDEIMSEHKRSFITPEAIIQSAEDLKKALNEKHEEN